MSPPAVHTHAAPLTTLAPHLAAHLPTSLPLLRRLQFHLQTPHALTLSTLPPSSPAGTPFAALYLDRSRAPETEAWLFSTAETSAYPNARRDVLALLAAAGQLPLPSNYVPGRTARFLRVGAVHRATLELLQDSPLDGGADEAVVSLAAALDNPAGGVVAGHTIPYAKFVIDPASVASFDPATPAAGLVWDVGRGGDFGLVVARTHIPRAPHTLALMPSAVLRVGGEPAEGAEWDADEVLAGKKEAKGRPVAWAFLGPDGSLASLHVEEDWRGRGLSRGLARRVVGMLARDAKGPWGGGFEGAGGAAWAHSDVARDNAASIAVAKGLGGVEGWECFWTELDTRRAGEELEIEK